uniref:hypothetical protein n=1 Tax=Poseidonocella sp. HB161398 TaxID=2320855 RepID=UPI00197DF5E8
ALACAAPAAASADPLARGSALAEAFLAGETGAIWDGAAPALRAALGTPEALGDLRTALAADFGTEEALLAQTWRHAARLDTYMRLARWSAEGKRSAGAG